MTVGKAIYYLLTNATDVTDIVSTRIFPEIAQQDAEMPYIVYNIANNEPSDTKPEPSKLDTAQVDVNVYSQSYTQCIDLAVAVRAALDRVSGTYSGVNVQSIQYLNEVIDFDEMQRAYNITSDYDVRISRTNFEIAQGSPITGVKLGELSDVNVVGVTDNQILSYDEESNTWVAADDAGGLVDSVNGQTGTVTLGLDDLTDVDAGAPTAGQLLAYGQGDWTTIAQDELTIGIENVTGLQAELNTIPDGIFDLDDVTQSGGSIAANSYIQYINGVWTNSAPPAPTPVYDELGELLDVTLTSPADNDFLRYNGTAWVNESITQYHNRYQSTAESLRAGATATTELYYTAQADGDGFAESASSDTPTAGYDIQRKLYYSEAAQADPDTGTWIQFAAIADNTTFANAKAALLAYLKDRTGGTVPISLKQTWEEVQQAPSFTGLLNESYGSGAAAAYSTRRLNGNVTECMVIRRASGTPATTTIGFDANGNIDEAAINTFCSGTSCTVETWKDQSGNGNDATQTTPANQPTIYTNGAIVKENGKVAVDFDGSTNILINTALQNSFEGAAQAFTMLHVAQTDNTSIFEYTFSLLDGANTTLAQNDQFGILAANDNKIAAFIRDYSTSTTSLPKSSAVVGTSQHLNTTVNTGSTLSVYASGTAGDSVSVNYPALAFDYASVGGRYGGSTPSSDSLWNGKIQEILAYASDKSANRTQIESNIGGYFTQNTPLLDTYSGAAAAYSLRKLSSSYNGSAIRVRRASDNAESDINFNVFGELDTVSLAAFCSGTNGFVKVWYDQSSTNDATQTNTANQPKIYDSVTGVMVDTKGNPAMEFLGTQELLSPSITAASQPVTAVSVVDTTNYNPQAHWFYSLGQSLYAGIQDNSSTMWMYAGTTFITSVSGATNTHRLDFSLFDGANSEIWFNSNSILTGDPGTNGITSIRIGGLANTKFKGLFNELVAYPSDQTTNRTNIEDNINTFYSIY